MILGSLIAQGEAKIGNINNAQSLEDYLAGEKARKNQLAATVEGGYTPEQEKKDNNAMIAGALATKNLGAENPALAAIRGEAVTPEQQAKAKADAEAVNKKELSAQEAKQELERIKAAALPTDGAKAQDKLTALAMNEEVKALEESIMNNTRSRTMKKALANYLVDDEGLTESIKDFFSGENTPWTNYERMETDIMVALQDPGEVAKFAKAKGLPDRVTKWDDFDWYTAIQEMGKVKSKNVRTTDLLTFTPIAIGNLGRKALGNDKKLTDVPE